MAAHTFPKARETRAPLVKELKKFKERISTKFHYLANAPVKDPDGFDTVVRYSRKTKQQYVMSENAEGKATGWSAWFDGGSWSVDDKRKKK